ncbi:MAG TPA: DUF882 domain-containing protein [Stellaceae bacterium]|jgi:uncharacterized protein YcbK (DUF882 family)|nr:DUF882 domain-containing protein [Stellaceae bacterium]
MDRRLFLSLIAGSVALPHFASAVPAPPPPAPALPSLVNRRLRLSNPHTGETFEGTYRDGNGPIPEVMDELNVFLRDFHANEQITIDVGVVDFLASVMDAVGQPQATILSAYRSPETNAALSKTHFGVAENSQHMYGRALDVHFGDKLADAMRAARKMQRGGVGWYPHSSFIHMDSGPVRNWDLDHTGLGTLIAGNKRVHFDKHGNLHVAKADKTTTLGSIGTSKAQVAALTKGQAAGAAKVQTAVLRGTAADPMTVRGRLSLLRQIAHASLKARTGT